MGKRTVLLVALLAASSFVAACSATPPAISSLMQQVSQASQSRDRAALRKCFATEGVTSEQIDQHLGSWDVYLDKESGAGDWTFSGVRYVSLADAAHDKDILPDSIASASGPVAMGGVTFTPNIKVAGFIIVSFKQANGMQGGATEDVGYASDGTAKIALVEPQK